MEMQDDALKAKCEFIWHTYRDNLNSISFDVRDRQINVGFKKELLSEMNAPWLSKLIKEMIEEAKPYSVSFQFLNPAVAC